MNYLILSNNSALGESVSGIPVKYINGDLEEIYDANESALQNRLELLTSPMPPNASLIGSPVRSVILRPTSRHYDAKFLLLLEKARERSRVLGVSFEPRFRKDLEFIDKDHIARAIEQLRELNRLHSPPCCRAD